MGGCICPFLSNLQTVVGERLKGSIHVASKSRIYSNCCVVNIADLLHTSLCFGAEHENVINHEEPDCVLGTARIVSYRQE